MKRIVFLLLTVFFCSSSPLWAQAVKNKPVTVTLDSVPNGHLYNEQYGIHLHLQLDSAALLVPGYETLGAVKGYMKGGIYGTWFLVRHERLGKRVRLRFSNDAGSASQTLLLIPQVEGHFVAIAEGGNELRRAEGRKLAKIADRFLFRLRK